MKKKSRIGKVTEPRIRYRGRVYIVSSDDLRGITMARATNRTTVDIQQESGKGQYGTLLLQTGEIEII